MDSLRIYIGSDHVIQHPKFDFGKNSLKVFSQREPAIRHACRRNAAGVLNTYQLNLDQLTVYGENQETLEGFDSFDVIISDDSTGRDVAICSGKALESLVFLGASFVSQ